MFTLYALGTVPGAKYTAVTRVPPLGREGGRGESFHSSAGRQTVRKYIRLGWGKCSTIEARERQVGREVGSLLG